MTKSLVFSTQELTLTLREFDYRALQARAQKAGLSASAMAAKILAQALQPDQNPAAPWTLDLIAAVDTVLNRYFEGLPRVLDQLAALDQQPQPESDGGVFRP